MLRSAQQKLSEAEYFLDRLKADWSMPNFDYNLSAFLSAITSCPEHNRLQVKDSSFPDWYRGAKRKYLSNHVWLQLREFRRQEIHFKGNETWQHISLPAIRPTPDMERGHSISWEIDLSAPGPTQEVEVFVDGEKASGSIEKHYAWSPDGQHIVEMCETGVQIIRDMLKDYNSMQFES
jgi:hypothetical protein